MPSEEEFDEVTNIYKPYHNLAYMGEDMELYSEIADYAKVKGGEASMQQLINVSDINLQDLGGI